MTEASRLHTDLSRLGEAPSWRRLGAQVLFAFAIIAVARGWTLSVPPYEDQANGMWHEAAYLAQSNFDYYSLRYNESHYFFGGQNRHYMISLLPTLLAVMMKLLPNAESVIVCWRLLGMLFAAVVAVQTYHLARHRSSVAIALLLVGMLFTTPSFLVQVDLAGMELPCIAFALGAAWYVPRERYVAAAVASLFSFLMKATGGLVTMALIAYLAVLIGLGQRSRKHWTGLASAAAVLGVQLTMLRIGDDTALFRATFPWPDMLKLPAAIYWCPDVVVVVLATAAITSVFVVSWLVNAGRPRDWLRVLRDVAMDRPPALSLAAFNGILIVGNLLSMVPYVFIPRYFALGLVLTYVNLGLLLPGKSRISAVATPVLVVAIWFNLCNLHGQFFPPVESANPTEFATQPLYYARFCAFSERSLEYIPDQESTHRAIRLIEERFRDHPIFIDRPLWIFLTRPFLGVVRTPPDDVYLGEVFLDNIREFRKRVLADPDGKDFVFVVVGKGRTRFVQPEQSDEILYDDKLSPPLMVYRVDRSRLPKTARAIEDWYLDHSWSPEFAMCRALERQEFLVEGGRVGRAMEEFREAQILHPKEDRFYRKQIEDATKRLADLAQRSVFAAGEWWTLQTDVPAHAVVSPLPDAEEGIRVVCESVDPDAPWRIRLRGQSQLVQASSDYEVRLRVRADRPRQVSLAFYQVFRSYDIVSQYHTVNVTEDWKEHRLAFTMTKTDDAALAFQLGSALGRVDLADIVISRLPGRRPD